MIIRAGPAVNFGEPAINPAPRRMMTEHLVSLAEESHHKGDFGKFSKLAAGVY